MRGWSLQTVLFMFNISNIANGIYLTAEYFMDQGQSTAFMGACGTTVGDACTYINSHVNTFRVTKYSANRNCWMLLDAGKHRNATYRLTFLRWELEAEDKDIQTCNKDFLEIHDGRYPNNTTLIGRYCGEVSPEPKPTKQHVSVHFVTNNSTGYAGFRILAVQTRKPPCSVHEFHCLTENRCIDGRLRCDGTVQCLDGVDEATCTSLERAFGRLLSLGLAGIIGLGVVLLCVILVTAVLLCCCCCRGHHSYQDKTGGRAVSVVGSPDGPCHSAWRVLPGPEPGGTTRFLQQHRGRKNDDDYYRPSSTNA